MQTMLVYCVTKHITPDNGRSTNKNRLIQEDCTAFITVHKSILSARVRKKNLVNKHMHYTLIFIADSIKPISKKLYEILILFQFRLILDTDLIWFCSLKSKLFIYQAMKKKSPLNVFFYETRKWKRIYCVQSIRQKKNVLKGHFAKVHWKTITLKACVRLPYRYVEKETVPHNDK